MNDSEASGLVLRKIYEQRDAGPFVRLDQLRDLGFNAIAMDRYLGHLADLNLIRRKPHRSGSSGELDLDFIQITGHGISSIEQPETAPPQITVNIQGSEVQIGNRHTQDIKVGIGTVQTPMDHSQSTRTTPQGASLVARIFDLLKGWFS